MVRLVIEQTTKYQDAQVLLNRVECLNDILTYNITIKLGTAYDEWLERHQALLDDLKGMLFTEYLQSVEKKDARKKRNNYVALRRTVPRRSKAAST
jgi:hypothetical protein